MAEGELHYPYRDLSLLRCLYSTLVDKERRFSEFTALSVHDLLCRIRKELPDQKYDAVPLDSEGAVREALDGLVDAEYISKGESGTYLFEVKPISFLLACTMEVPPAYENAAFKVVPGWLKEHYPWQNL